jgi:hypothetical protein
VSKALDFKISSGLKNIIGKELITNDRIAIFELVKNSYDASASSVKIIFQNINQDKDKKPAKVMIIDDGEGMSYDDIVNKWLFVGFSDKKDHGGSAAKDDFRSKIKTSRIFAGAKGVGRFSCDRLGRKLRIYTKKRNEQGIHYLEIDWTKFEEDQEKEFQTIDVDYTLKNRVEVEGYSLKDFKNGTILEISELNDKWDADKLVELKNYLQRLINPNQDEESQNFKIFLEAKEYLEESTV